MWLEESRGFLMHDGRALVGVRGTPVGLPAAPTTWAPFVVLGHLDAGDQAEGLTPAAAAV